MLLAPLAAPLVDVIPASAAPGKMVLSIHQTTSQRAGYRKILEGWAKAGIKYVEITDRVLDDFLKTDSMAAAKSVITDNGLTPVSGAAVLQDFWNKNPGFDAQLETWKKRCEQFASLGLTKIYCPSTTNRKVTEEDYKTAPDAIREAGDVAKQYNLDWHDRVRAQLHADRHADHFAQADPGSGASQRTPDARLLSLLVGHGQVRGSGYAQTRRTGPCAFPGHAGYSSRAVRANYAIDSGRRRDPFGQNLEEARGEGL